MESVLVERAGNRILARARYYQGLETRFKRITGASFRRGRQIWSFPLRLEVCRELRSEFQEELEIGPLLAAWAWDERNKRTTMIELGKRETAELTATPQLAPKMYKAMATRPRQLAGAQFIATGKRVGVFDEPGAGKTIMTMSGLMEAGKWEGRHLCLAPKTALNRTWVRQIHTWTDGLAVSVPDGPAARQKVLDQFFSEQDGPRFLVVHPHMLQVKIDNWCPKCEAWEDQIGQAQGSALKAGGYTKHFMEGHEFDRTRIRKMDWPQLFEAEWDSILADEVQQFMLKIRPTGHGVKMPQWAEGLMRLQSSDDGLKVAMTGTPMRGLERNMFGILHWLRPAYHSSYWQFVGHYLHQASNGFGIDVGNLRTDAQEWFYEMLDSMSIRRTRKEMRPEMIEMDNVDVWVEMTPKQKRQYKEFEQHGESSIESGAVIGLGILSELTRLRQMAFGLWETEIVKTKRVQLGDRTLDIPVEFKVKPTGESPKIDYILDFLNERGVRGDNTDTGSMKYIVASQFTEVLSAVGDRLTKAGIEWREVSGRVTGKKRDLVIEDFNENPHGFRVLLMQTVTGGVSLTMDRYCDEMLILDETWKDDDQTQLKGRIDNREGEIRPRTAHYVRTLGTIDEAIAKLNESQDNLQKKVLDKRRGVDVALRLVRGAA